MKKILMALSVIFVFSATAFAGFNEEWQEALQKNIEMNQILGACISGQAEYGPVILGKTNKNECHYQYFTEFNGKKYPYQDCYVPMDVLKKYTDLKITQLKEGKLNSSSYDMIKKYCKTLPLTIYVN